MIRLSPPEYGFVQVERPVVSDVKPFLAQAQEIGNLVLGYETVSSLSSYGVEVSEDDGSAAELVRMATPVGMPVLEVAGSNELSLVLLHRSVPRELISSYGILRARRVLDQQFITRREKVLSASGKEERALIRMPGMLADVEDVSFTHGLDPNCTPVVFNRVDVIGEPGNNFVLGLFPDPAGVAAHALHQQSKIAAYHLTRQNGLKRLTRPMMPWQVGIPFARLPSDVNTRNYGRLMGELNDLDPPRMALGRVQVTLS